MSETSKILGVYFESDAMTISTWRRNPYYFTVEDIVSVTSQLAHHHNPLMTEAKTKIISGIAEELSIPPPLQKLSLRHIQTIHELTALLVKYWRETQPCVPPGNGSNQKDKPRTRPESLTPNGR